MDWEQLSELRHESVHPLALFYPPHKHNNLLYADSIYMGPFLAMRHDMFHILRLDQIPEDYRRVMLIADEVDQILLYRGMYKNYLPKENELEVDAVIDTINAYASTSVEREMLNSLMSLKLESQRDMQHRLYEELSGDKQNYFSGRPLLDQDLVDFSSRTHEEKKIELLQSLLSFGMDQQESKELLAVRTIMILNRMKDLAGQIVPIFLSAPEITGFSRGSEIIKFGTDARTKNQ